MDMEQVLKRLDELKDSIHELDIKIAGLSDKYVRREEFDQYRIDAISAKKWAISTFVSVLALAIPIVVVFIK